LAALFTLVGIAGEDDVDAPDLLSPPPPQMKNRQSDREQRKTASTAAKDSLFSSFQADGQRKRSEAALCQSLSPKRRLRCVTN
jgi:hypothetical protein